MSRGGAGPVGVDPEAEDGAGSGPTAGADTGAASAAAAAVAVARDAQRSWGAFTAAERASRMKALGRVLRLRGGTIAGRIVAETGKARVEALAEVSVAAELITYYVREAPGHLAPRRVSTGWMLGKRAWVEREPYGVVGAITPWNYPFLLVMDAVVPALFGGNTVVVKPSEFTPGCAELIPELCREAGLPDGLCTVLNGDGALGAALVTAGVDRVLFTGSSATGRKVMKAAAGTLTPVTLELGGKDPAIVLEDADLERAARGVVYGAFYNAGQTCISVERAFVVAPLYDAFVERVVEEVERLRTEPDADGVVDMGRMVTEAQMAVVEDQVENARSLGATVRTGGSRAPGQPRVYLPTVLTDVTSEMKVMTEETFGPVLAIASVADEDEAVERANAPGFGLFASVWTGDRERGVRVGRRLRSGGWSVNDVLSHYAVPGLPMGGSGASGFGRRRGLEALDEMTRARSVFVDRVGLSREPWWFPYSTAGERAVRTLLDWRATGGLRGLAAAATRLLRRGGESS